MLDPCRLPDCQFSVTPYEFVFVDVIGFLVVCLITALKKQRPAHLCELWASLVYMTRAKPAKAT